MAAAKRPSSRKPARARSTERTPELHAGHTLRHQANGTATTRGGTGVVALTHQVRTWADEVLGAAGAAADLSLGAARAIAIGAGQRKALASAGMVLRKAREAAGLSLAEVATAVDLRDPALLALVEKGRVALPFEVVLRLASVLARNDPISFVLRFTRSWNPGLWRALEDLGVGRLAIQAGREREFANLYRASDRARTLSDDEFAAVLAFTRAAFEAAMALRDGGVRTKCRRAPHRQRTGRA